MAEGDFITQVVIIPAGECVILPSDAVVQGVTEFGGGVASSECVLPPPEGTTRYYFYVEEDPAEEGDQLFCLVDLTIGTYVVEFPGGCNRIALTSPPISSNVDFTNTVKAHPLVLQLRGAMPGNAIVWSLDVPVSAPVPYFNAYFTNDSDPWHVRLYPLATDDVHYDPAVAQLASDTTIL